MIMVGMIRALAREHLAIVAMLMMTITHLDDDDNSDDDGGDDD